MSSYHKKMMAMLDGVEGMDDTSASLVRWAQNAFGDAGGDVARAVVQAPATFARGIGGGAVSANAGINQMLRDYTPLGALPVVGYWLQDAANQGSKDAARINQAQQQTTKQLLAVMSVKALTALARPHRLQPQPLQPKTPLLCMAAWAHKLDSQSMVMRGRLVYHRLTPCLMLAIRRPSKRQRRNFPLAH
ncbi:Uncharacterised protein [Neisseria dentiae]|uniref:hypothetical protein n=1 Tax=Neisseria dentiae TaxID=194197 RepID=UPI000DFF8077|nr:hypothetical protein [Neisseria dentiae]STZ49870.1 Uncharacterised protein [Neisseria dentiae]